jgi:DNA-binding LacI/PurR family transcriptional regulator
MRVRLRDIAEKVNLSVGSVSLILRDQRTDEYTPETIARVQQAASTLGYQPNGAARIMQRGHFGGIGWIQSAHYSYSTIAVALAAGVHDEAFRAKIHVIVARLPDEALSGNDYLPMLLQERVADGLLVSYTSNIPAPVLDAIQRAGVPVVWINMDFETDCVRPDDFGAGRMATEHLLAHGHRRIAYVNLGHTRAEALERGHYSQRHRLEGYRAAMQAAGLPPRVLFSSARRFLDEQKEEPPVETDWLGRPDAPTALVSYSAFGAASCLARTPDLSIVTFAPLPARCDDTRRIDTVVVPDYAIGQEAVTRLRQKISDHNQPFISVRAPFTLVCGDTVAPPRTTTISSRRKHKQQQETNHV